jgi:SpoVK/Ycf46/Vps4 family AAA+-type ATPase
VAKFVPITAAEIESKWVGETPQNIARVFDDACNTRTVLFFDEFDGLARARTDSSPGYHITQVAQLLTSIDNFLLNKKNSVSFFFFI